MRPRISLAEQSARDLLTSSKVLAPPVDVMRIARNQGALLKQEKLEENVSGLLIVRGGDTKPVIAVNEAHHLHRRRFTIAHEIGHLMLHSDDPKVFVDGMLVHFRDTSKTERASPQELEANAFAAALLMPAAFLETELRGRVIDADDEEAVGGLAKAFLVSPQALTLRLLRLNLLHGMLPTQGP